jgi:hypothetical protein
MGRPLPGYVVALLDPLSGEPAQEGEITLDLSHRPLGLMTGYHDSAQRGAADTASGYYHTGDVAARDDEVYIAYIGRTDDVFKTSDYRTSPFELESVLIEHEAVRPPSTSCASRASTWHRTSGCGGSSSPSYRRRSRANPPGRAAHCRAEAPARRRAATRPRAGRVLGGGLPGAAPLTQ